MADSIAEDVLEELAKVVIFDTVDKAFNKSGHRILLGSWSALDSKARELAVKLDLDAEIDIEELIEDAIIELNVSWAD